MDKDWQATSHAGSSGAFAQHGPVSYTDLHIEPLVLQSMFARPTTLPLFVCRLISCAPAQAPVLACLQAQGIPPDSYGARIPEWTRQRFLEAHVPQPKHPSTCWRPLDCRSGSVQEGIFQGEGAQRHLLSHFLHARHQVRSHHTNERV